MQKIAYLTMDHLDDFECYDELTLPHLKDLGWQVEMVSWRADNIDWDQYKAVIIRSPWDYQDDAAAFANRLTEIEASKAELLNSKSTCEWNINKTYLRELESKGAAIVPTLWPEHFDANQLAGYFTHFKTEQIILKPLVSANADNTFWLKKSNYADKVNELEQCFKAREFMVQPFMQSVIDEGEFSLFYFAHQYSHCILKTPKADDFRVQEEHGGRLKAVEPEPKLLEQAEQILKLVSPKTLYARVDVVRHGEQFALMELELIEPSLYFNMDSQSPKRFAQALNDWLS
jgi:glutathione synthase/RimK-type ligase-like ATP-grasp enzyme